MKAAQALAQWLGGVKTGQGALEAAEAKLSAHLSNPPESADAGEHRAWLATQRQLEEAVEAEKRALLVAEKKAAEMQVAAAKEEGDAEEHRIRKLNDELAKAVVDFGAKIERLAPDAERYRQMLAEVEAWNASRGGRAFIVDGEARVRSVLDRIIPAVFENVDVWEDGAGSRPSVFRKLDSGELVPAEGGYMKRRERVQISREQVIHVGIPGGRFRDAIRLIGLKGEALFPPK